MLCYISTKPKKKNNITLIILYIIIRMIIPQINFVFHSKINLKFDML